MTKKKSASQKLHEFYAKQKGHKPQDEAKIFPDSFGISCVECDRCQTFIPKVEVGQMIVCPICNFSFKVVK